MNKFLARMERRFGRFAIPNLVYYIVGGMGLVWVLSVSRPGVADILTLDMAAVRAGQVWRLATFLLIPPPSSPFWIFFTLYFTWMIGTNLESEWGAFKLNLFYFLGAAGTIAAATFAGGEAGNGFLNLTMFLAFATLFPNFQIMLFWVIPVRVKWFAIAIFAYLAFSFVTGSWAARSSVLAATANYLLFFGGHFRDLLKQRNATVRQAARRASLAPQASDAATAAEPVVNGRTCALCGKTQGEGADIRVCTCEKCGGPRNLCLEHARNH
jgi:hypothetical protein